MFKHRRVQDVAEVMRLSVADARQARVSPDQFTQAGHLGLVAVDAAGVAVGAILLVPHRRVAASVISFRLAWIYVAESDRRKGIATGLLKAAAREAAALGVSRIYVDVDPGDSAGMALIDNLGPDSGAAFVICLRHGGL